jgi:hypothetical protein
MTTEAITPLRRRMIEGMTVRNFVEKTRNDYIRHVRTFTVFLGHELSGWQVWLHPIRDIRWARFIKAVAEGRTPLRGCAINIRLYCAECHIWVKPRKYSR